MVNQVHGRLHKCLTELRRGTEAMVRSVEMNVMAGAGRAAAEAAKDTYSKNKAWMFMEALKETRTGSGRAKKAPKLLIRLWNWPIAMLGNR